MLTRDLFVVANLVYSYIEMSSVSTLG